MAGPADILGTGEYVITANISEVKPKMEEATRVVEVETAKAGAAVEKNLTQNFTKSVGAVRGFIAAAAGVVATAVAFERLGEAIGNMALHFIRAKDAADDLRASARQLDFKGIQSEIDGLNDKVTSGTSNLVNYFNRLTDFTGLTEAASREAKIAILEEARAREQANNALERANELTRKGIELQKEFVQTFQFSFEGQIAAMAEQFGPLFDDYKSKVLDPILDADRKAHQERLQQILEEGRARVKSHRESAAAFADAMQKALSDVAKSGTFRQDVAGPLEEILRDIQSTVETLKYGGGR